MSNKHVFWQALIAAFVIFWTGIMFGVWFESYRADNLEEIYFNAETDIFDVQLESDMFDILDIGCDAAVKENINFADRIYWEARRLEKYDAATEITDDILNLHKRYDLLRVMLWKNLISLEERCPKTVNVVVYLYQYDNPSIETRATQAAISSTLLDLKEKYGGEVILIPIAGDIKLKSLGLLLDNYELDDFPVVLINGEHKIEGLVSVVEMERYLN